MNTKFIELRKKAETEMEYLDSVTKSQVRSDENLQEAVDGTVEELDSLVSEMENAEDEDFANEAELVEYSAFVRTALDKAWDWKWWLKYSL